MSDPSCSPFLTSYRKDFGWQYSRPISFVPIPPPRDRGQKQSETEDFDSQLCQCAILDWTPYLTEHERLCAREQALCDVLQQLRKDIEAANAIVYPEIVKSVYQQDYTEHIIRPCPDTRPFQPLYERGVTENAYRPPEPGLSEYQAKYCDTGVLVMANLMKEREKICERTRELESFCIPPLHLVKVGKK